MKIDLRELRKRSEYINEVKHPTLDLLIFNYSHKCQYAKAWDEYTKMTRGLITDLEGNVVARPFRKFFNMEEYQNEIPIISRQEEMFIYPKYDGSLGIQYYDGNEVRISTRGSFGSDQAKWATEWMQKQGFKRNDFLDGKTYLYEIIYKENRIVVDYKNEEMLVLLAVVDTETGEENPRLFEDEASRLKLRVAKHIDYISLEHVVKNISEDEEGYVLHWPYQDNFRLKVKGAEYVRLHRLLTQVSSKSIWELLKNNQPLDEVIERVPDEFYTWVKKTKEELEQRAQAVIGSATYCYDEVKNLPTRKGQAEVIISKYKDVASIVFSILDNKDPMPIVWRGLKPKYERPFKQDIDAT